MKRTTTQTDVLDMDRIKMMQDKVLDELQKIRQESERKSQLLATYQAEPLNVVPVSDLREEIRTGLKDVVRRVESSDSRTVKDIGTMLDEKLPSLMDKALEDVQRDTDSLWWHKILFVIVAVALVLALTSGALTLYDRYWSDEAWARRAYDAAVFLDNNNKDIIYHGVRQRLVDGDRKSTRRQVRAIERQVKEVDKTSYEE